MPYYVLNSEEHKLSSANLYYDAPMIEQVRRNVTKLSCNVVQTCNVVMLGTLQEDRGTPTHHTPHTTHHTPRASHLSPHTTRLGTVQDKDEEQRRHGSARNWRDCPHLGPLGP